MKSDVEDLVLSRVSVYIRMMGSQLDEIHSLYGVESRSKKNGRRMFSIEFVVASYFVLRQDARCRTEFVWVGELFCDYFK